MSLPPPFVSGTTTAGLAPHADLQKELTKRLDAADASVKVALQHIAIALIDLTDIHENPDPAGPFNIPYANNGAMADKDMRVGSLSKIAGMYAAFKLRQRSVTLAAAAVADGKDVDDVIHKITKAWNPIVTQKVKKSPNDFPNLKHVFNFGSASPWKPEFRDSASTSWKDLQQIHDDNDNDDKPFNSARVDPLEFMDRLRLSIRMSDDMAAGSVVRDVSFQFMNGSLADDGFNDDSKNGVLWLGTDFGYRIKEPIMYAPVWARENDPTWVRATARGIASFLALVWTNRLVDQDSCIEMRELLRERNNVGYTTNITSKTPDAGRVWSKVGLLRDYATISEGFIVESKTGGKHLRYAGAALDAKANAPLEALAVIFHDSILAIH